MKVIDIKNGNDLLAEVFLSSETLSQNMEFFTDPDASLQVGIAEHKLGHKIPRHRHLPAVRQINGTGEILIILSGILLVSYYGSDGEQIRSHQLKKGEILVHYSGAHGFEVIEPCRFIEVKQGPYLGFDDKEKF